MEITLTALILSFSFREPVEAFKRHSFREKKMDQFIPLVRLT